MFSEKAYKNAEACRFCWMCRHLCPVQLVTGKETNTPRAKGLLVSMMKRGMPMEADSARTMYECLLCGACTNDCATGFDPLVFIREGVLRPMSMTLFPHAWRRLYNVLRRQATVTGRRSARSIWTACPSRASCWYGWARRRAIVCPRRRRRCFVSWTKRISRMPC